MSRQENGRFRQKNVIITGGSSGIGLAIAKEFARLGSHLFLVARDLVKLEKAQKLLREEYAANSIEIFSADVAEEQAIKTVIERIGDEFGGIHTLINNAGIMVYGRFAELSPADLGNCMAVNYQGAVNCLNAAWPYLKKADRGHIGFVSSVAGYVGLIGYSAYTPTKYALSGLAECIRMEAKDEEIGVTIVYPPDTQTPQLEYEHRVSLPETRAINKNASILTPEQVARSFVAGIQRGRFEVFCNRESKWIRIFKYLSPSFFFRQIDGIVAKDRRRRKV